MSSTMLVRDFRLDLGFWDWKGVMGGVLWHQARGRVMLITWYDLGRITGAAIKGIRDFIETYEAVGMLFDIREDEGLGRVGTGRLQMI